ncbi:MULTISPECIES: HypC/HybG/HupF family hydrogenase formation chaperone [unclassified Moraxella]|uniref:HypC/HybG/HupF family hydrogenase formation chaperone n=1 Tax=unclassified Moraxella TaxID=2685852 RepID=UPI003AF42F29
MCLALPAKVIAIHASQATINLGGVQKTISIELVPTVAVGDYVVVHVGYAIGIIDPVQAEQTLQLFANLESDTQNLPPTSPVTGVSV